MQIEVLRTDGTREHHQARDLDAIKTLIGCATIDTVTLTREAGGAGWVMLVDDDGYEVELVDHGEQPDPRRPGHTIHVMERRCTTAKKPINQAATTLYWATLGHPVDHHIVGDVAIVRDSDFT